MNHPGSDMVTPVLANYGILIFIPLFWAAAGVLFISIAMRDRKDHQPAMVRRLPTAKDHPLHHVRVSMAATRRKARLAARKAAGEGQEARKRPPGGRPPRLKAM
jgi:hypothetical protein